MRVLAISYFPVLSTHDQGGAQHVFVRLCRALARRGVRITVLCPPGDGIQSREVRNGLVVVPALQQIDRSSRVPYQRQETHCLLAKHAAACDVIWTLDRAVPFPMPQPIVLSLSNFSYVAEMESLWRLSWDVLVVPSPYLRDVTATFVGPNFWYGDAIPRTVIIPNGVDQAEFRPVSHANLMRTLGLRRDEKYIIFPHRPDARKGFEHMLQILARLVALDSAYHLLVPVNATYRTDRAFYDKLRTRATSLGISRHVHFHAWVARQDLAQYFSLADLCVSLSTLPEGFGLTPVQSIACGTPVICRRSGALTGQFPPSHGVQYLDFHDDASHIASFTSLPMPNEIRRGQRYLRKHYSEADQADQFFEVFMTAQKSNAFFNPVATSLGLALAPWCRRVDADLIWHDYRGRYLKLSGREQQLLESLTPGCPLSVKDTSEEAALLLRKGIVVSVPLTPTPKSSP